MKYKNIYLVITFIFILYAQSAHTNINSDESESHFKKYLCTTKKTNIIRQSPTTHSEILVRLKKYVPLEVIDKTQGWFRVKGFKMSSFSGWVHESIVSSKISCMQINKTYNIYCSFRKGRNRRFYKHEGFKVLKVGMACNLVEDKFGKKYRINSIGSWPKTLVKMIHI
jgi:SH3-like domain-containing protein